MKKEQSDLSFTSPRVVDPATIVAALKVASYVATIVGLGVSWSSARKTKKQLQEIINFLRVIAQDLKEIKAQNELIIKRLNELPNEIGAIVAEIVQINELNNRYNDLDAIQKIFEANLKTNERFHFKNGSVEYNEIYQHLNYLTKYEIRIGFCLDIIRYCEISDLVTNHDEGMRNYIKDSVLLPKIEYLRKIHAEIKNKIEQKAQKLFDNITSNGEFIQTTNLNEIKKLDDLMIEYKLDKPTTKVIRGGNPVHDTDWEKTVEIPEAIEFNKKKAELSKEVSEDKALLLEFIKYREEVNSIGVNYALYRQGLN